ncbi:hypothetical protein [Actinophytocola sp.]|uniref:hypothetical protein n=1 Tax=Actinophytocola sp. TaxID=1872138 RepID=UPI002ED33E07
MSVVAGTLDLQDHTKGGWPMGRFSRQRYTLRIERLDGRSLAHDPGPVDVVFDLDDDEEFERICATHFVPLACAAELTRPCNRLREMPFLGEYVLEVWHESNARKPVATSRSTVGYDDRP